MFDVFKKRYQELKESPPGKRFQELHARRADRGGGKKLLRIGAAVGVIVAGLAMLVLPGPGILLVVVGLALIAQELSYVARGLDWMELRLRKLFGMAK